VERNSWLKGVLPQPVKRPHGAPAKIQKSADFSKAADGPQPIPENENSVSDEFSKERSRLSHFKIPLPLPFYLAHLPWVLADTTLQLQLTLPVTKGTQVARLSSVCLRFRKGSGLSRSGSLPENPV
jgi:hypothetical protein